MISSKLKKGKPSQLLIEFSKDIQQWPMVITKFHQVCKDQNVKISKSNSLKPHMLRFYIVNETDNQSLSNNNRIEYQHVGEDSKVLKSSISNIQLKLTLIYMNDEQQHIPQFSQLSSSQQQKPPSRILLLRQTLSSFYDLNYQIQSTLSPQQSISYLCELSATLVNCKHQGDMQHHHQQKKQLMIKKGNQGKLKLYQAAWRNMMFQVPGIGRDKAKNIAESFGCYQAIIDDIGSKKRLLKDLVVGRGVKGAKIGKAIAERVYKVFGSENAREKLY